MIAGLPSAHIFDVTRPLEAFSSASRFLSIPPYATEIVSTDGGSIVSTGGPAFGSTPIDEVSVPPIGRLRAVGAELPEGGGGAPCHFPTSISSSWSGSVKLPEGY